MEQIIWKDIRGFEGLYHVCSKGGLIKALEKIRPIGGNKNSLRVFPEKIMKPSKGKTQKYFTTTLMKDGIPHYFSVHYLVLSTFEPNDQGLDINHIDLDKENNDRSNLEWGTKSYNSTHAFLNGCQPGAFKKGVENPISKKCIDQLTGVIYDSMKEAWINSTLPMVYDTFCKQLNGKLKNKTNYVIYEEHNTI